MITFFGAIMREKIIAGNWKMHGTLEFAKEYLNFIFPYLKNRSKNHSRVLLAVPYPLLSAMASMSFNSCLEIGAQNIHEELSGAFTGEVSASLVKDVGASFTIIGHSERRQFFKESDELIRKKISRALSCHLNPILCVGESLEQREAGQAKKTLEEQLVNALQNFSPEELLKVTIAYEPIWAIGTGKSASADLAEEMHFICREKLGALSNKEFAQRIPILYGGSVNPENSKQFFSKENIDGALVGGASLNPASFLEIIHSS